MVLRFQFYAITLHKEKKNVLKKETFHRFFAPSSFFGKTARKDTLRNAIPQAARNILYLQTKNIYLQLKDIHLQPEHIYLQAGDAAYRRKKAFCIPVGKGLFFQT